LIRQDEIDLHYPLSNPPCRSLLLLAKSLGVELNLKPLKEEENTTPEFLKVITLH
jgi:hypothetical protein